ELGPCANPMLALGRLWAKDTQSWHLKLPEQWLDYEAHTLPIKMRGNLRRRLKNLAAVDSVSYFSAPDEIAAKIIFNALCAHRHIRFRRLGRAASRVMLEFGVAQSPAT